MNHRIFPCLRRFVAIVAATAATCVPSEGSPPALPTGSAGSATPSAKATVNATTPLWLENFQGLWFASPAESQPGWGIQIAHQENTLLATWYTYDADGSATWFVMPGLSKTREGRYMGEIYRTRSLPGTGQFNLLPFTLAQREGTAQFDFTDADNGLFRYEIAGRTAALPITRQIYAPEVRRCRFGFDGVAPLDNYQDLWWNAPAGSESGWGVQIAHQADILFATFFGYDATGKPRWLVMPAGRKTALGRYAGAVYSTRGPAYDAAPWRAEDVSIVHEGDAVFTFSGRSIGRFEISPAGESRIALERSITRQVFAAFPTICD